MKTKVAIIIPPALKTSLIPAEMMLEGALLNKVNKKKVKCDLFDLNFKYRHEDCLMERISEVLSLFVSSNKNAEPIIFEHLKSDKHVQITKLVKKLIEGLSFSQYDVIVLGILELNHAKIGLCFAKYLKKITKKTIVLGNISDATCCYDVYRLHHFIEHFDFIDYLIDNMRGYDILLNFLNNYPLNLNKIDGLIYRKKDVIIYNDGYCADKKNFFTYDLNRISPSLSMNEKKMKFLNYIFYEIARGCNNTCFFCHINFYPYIIKSPEKVVDDVKKLIARYHIDNFALAGSSINYHMSWLNKFLEEIKKEKLNFRWITTAIPKNLGLDILKKMAMYGCVMFQMGFESRYFNRLRTLSKNINIDETDKILKNCNEAGICVRPLFIVGFPHETDEEFQMIEDFIRKNYRYFNAIEIQTFKLMAHSPLFCEKAKMEKFRIRPRKPGVFDLNYIPYDEICGMCWEEKYRTTLQKRNYLFSLCKKLNPNCFVSGSTDERDFLSIR